MRKHTISFFLLFSLFSVITVAQENICLNGLWKFALAKNSDEAAKIEDFYTPGYKNNIFTDIKVPSNWAVLGFEEPTYRGFKDNKASEGFYIHEFDTPKDWNTKRVLLNFGGVWESAEVWLNGVNLGRHDCGYTSFSFDLTGKLSKTGKNTLAVRVRQVTRDYKIDVYDDWTLGGIYRDVTLESMPSKRWIDNIAVKTTFDKQFEDADLEIKAMVCDKNKRTLPGNYPSPGEPYVLRSVLSDKQGNVVVKRELTVPAHTSTSREIKLKFHIESPKQWNAEHPYLYNLDVELLEGGNVAHRRSEKIGFRQISTTGGVFRINGQSVKLRGVNRHDEFPDVGRATTREHWIKDLKLMKEANINYLRLSHYTPAKGFIELCDEMGMYVGNEVCIGGSDNIIYDPSYSGAILLRSYETVKRDIDNPSIIYWSIGNEDPLTPLHLVSIKVVKSLDPTRPVLIPWRHEEWLPEEIDILAPHYWKFNEYDKLAAHSTRPIISTEYTHAYGNEGFGGLEKRWKELTKHPAGAGAAIWMWADQGIHTPVKKANADLSDDPYLRITNDGWDGIVDSYRKLTQDYFETKSVYCPVYPTVSELSFTSGEQFLNIPIQNDYDFTNLNELTVNWSIFSDENEIDKGKTTIDCNPHSQAFLKLNIGILKNIDENKTYYVWLSFKDKSGFEIGRKAVELRPIINNRNNNTKRYTLSVIKDNNLIVKAGNVNYAFNPKTGQLVSASSSGKDIISDLKPTIWRNLDKCEAASLGNSNSKLNYNDFTQKVNSWKVKKTDSEVIIKTDVDCIIDKNNSFMVSYLYTINDDGSLKINYQISPKVQTQWLPVIGLNFRANNTLNNVRWLGLGLSDSYSNRNSAAIFGVWKVNSKDKEIHGTKTMRWLEESGKDGKLTINSNGYFSLDENDVNKINIFSYVYARPEKGRKAEDYYPQLKSEPGVSFNGECVININN